MSLVHVCLSTLQSNKSSTYEIKRVDSERRNEASDSLKAALYNVGLECKPCARRVNL